MGQHLDSLALVGQLQHAHAAEVVDLERVEEWVVEADTGRAVDDDLGLRGHHGPIRRANSQLIDD